MRDIKRVVDLNSRDKKNTNAKEMQMPYVILPVDKDDFQKLSDVTFLKFLACFGVNVNMKGQPG